MESIHNQNVKAVYTFNVEVHTPSALDLDYNAGNLHKVLQLLKRITGGEASKRSLRRNDAVAITG